ncbi:MAG: hypothetical protein ABIY55_18385, partial [Kofleriaceae bacterium]
MLLGLAACGSSSLVDARGPGEAGVSGVVVTLSPAMASLVPGATQQFAAGVTGTTNQDVSWTATGGTITPAGLYTAPEAGGGYTVRATSAADAGASAVALVLVAGGAAAPEPFYDAQHDYAQLMTPMPEASYFAPATIRMWAHAPDRHDDSVNGYAPRVDFYLGTTMVGSVAIGDNDPIDYYQVDVPGVAAGSYELFVRSHIGGTTVDSVHVP